MEPTRTASFNDEMYLEYKLNVYRESKQTYFSLPLFDRIEWINEQAEKQIADSHSLDSNFGYE